jgi:hopanoid C-3 methylase
VGARHWSRCDRHHLLWEPALGPRRFFELYCETWRRSVLNLRGRKRAWHWLREVDPANALFLLRALRRTQRLMDPDHYLQEYDLAPAPEQSPMRLPPQLITLPR